MQTTTIRPGLLVSLNTSVQGNVSYRATTIEGEHTTTDGSLKATWETEKTIADPAEFKRATEVRSKARSLIGGVCVHSAFGYLCPEADADVLQDRIAQAQQLARDFNATATLTRVNVRVIAGRIAADDVQAAKAINSEISDLLEKMAQGVKDNSVEAIRDAANRAKQLGTMVTQDNSIRLQKAIDAARSAARAIVKAGEAAAIEIDQRAVRAIMEGRTAFLDLDDAAPMQAPTVTGRAIDMEEQAAPIVQAPKAAALELDDAEPMQAAAPTAPQLELI